jgi:hypothetical protein
VQEVEVSWPSDHPHVRAEVFKRLLLGKEDDAESLDRPGRCSYSGSRRADNRDEVIDVIELPLLHRPEKVAVQLGLCRRKVFELIRDGRLRSVKIDHSRRVLDRHLREFVDQLGVASE